MTNQPHFNVRFQPRGINPDMDALRKRLGDKLAEKQTHDDPAFYRVELDDYLDALMAARGRQQARALAEKIRGYRQTATRYAVQGGRATLDFLVEARPYIIAFSLGITLGRAIEAGAREEAGL